MWGTCAMIRAVLSSLSAQHDFQVQMEPAQEDTGGSSHSKKHLTSPIQGPLLTVAMAFCEHQDAILQKPSRRTKNRCSKVLAWFSVSVIIKQDTRENKTDSGKEHWCGGQVAFTAFRKLGSFTVQVEQKQEWSASWLCGVPRASS
jgi:hypothetical protein